jgi:hypothetical protein
MAEFERLVLPAYVHDPDKVGPVLESLGRSSFNTELAAHYFGNRAALYVSRPRGEPMKLPGTTLPPCGRPAGPNPPVDRWPKLSAARARRP